MLRRNGLVCMMSIFLFANCNKEESIFQGPLSKEETFAVFDECRDNPDNQLKITEAITENLIGEWQLVSYGCGFCVPLDKAPKATLTLNENAGILDLEYGGVDDTLLAFNWVIENERFVSTPPHFALNMTDFCEEYMLFDGRASDGLMMIYQKQ